MTADKIDVTIRIHKAESGRLGEIVDVLKSRGLQQVESHERFMIVNGSVSPDAIDALRTVKGVASVRTDTIYKAQAR
ncbi:hypothetical protein [Mesorhizobium sp.]|uniref:hypothetical protein n=1 Tax=Mesorhizobium sp. TaxID=1871066 RepID=UPI000FE73003|nr:hypothetical protein [Mesorhizobium sp.]RWP54624.1 MAG: hypothetical protein EOR07_33890 [Mesorhizobium sp.]